MSDALPWLAALLGSLTCCWIVMLIGLPLLPSQIIAGACGIGWGCGAIQWSNRNDARR